MNDYVDLMGDRVPSPQDISNRMRDEVLAGVGQMPEWMFLVQKLVAVCLGAITGDPDFAYEPTPEEMAEFRAFGAMAREVQARGRKARSDAVLLRRVLDHEQDLVQLAEDDVEGQELLARRAAVRPAEPQDDESTTEAS